MRLGRAAAWTPASREAALAAGPEAPRLCDRVDKLAVAPDAWRCQCAAPNRAPSLESEPGRHLCKPPLASGFLLPSGSPRLREHLCGRPSDP